MQLLSELTILGECVLNFEKQNQLLTCFVTSHSHATSAIFVAVLSIDTKGKLFTDNEYLKNAFKNCSEYLFNYFANENKSLRELETCHC